MYILSDFKVIEQAKSHVVELFFMDAAHFVMGGFAGRVWSVVRKYVKTASGRKRYNVLGRRSKLWSMTAT